MVVREGKFDWRIIEVPVVAHVLERFERALKVLGEEAEDNLVAHMHEVIERAKR